MKIQILRKLLQIKLFIPNQTLEDRKIKVRYS